MTLAIVGSLFGGSVSKNMSVMRTSGARLETGIVLYRSEGNQRWQRLSTYTHAARKALAGIL